MSAKLTRIYKNGLKKLNIGNPFEMKMSKQLISSDVMGVWYVFRLLFLLNESKFHDRIKVYMHVNLSLVHFGTLKVWKFSFALAAPV